MKRCAVLLLLLALTACTPKPTTTQTLATTAPTKVETQEHYDFVYDMSDRQWLADFFEEKSDVEWSTKGKYTMLLEGLHTPVVLQMDGEDVISVSAYGHTKEVVIYTFEGAANMNIRTTEDMVVVNDSRDYDGRTWIFTAKKCLELVPDGSISTEVYLDDNGELYFIRSWGEYCTTFNHDDYAPLYLCTSRDHFLYDKGCAEIVDGELVLTTHKTRVVSDIYDLDALFAEAKAQGLFAEYDNVDALLDANKNKG